MQSLRGYQVQALDSVEKAWRSGKRAPLLVAPTGSGKTTIVAHLIAKANKQTLFLCPWRQLVMQAHERLLEHGVKAGILMGKKSPKPDEPVHIATVQTAARRKLGDYDLIVIDEAHRAIAGQCQRILSSYPKTRMVGLTAAPIRLDGKPMATAFDVMLDNIEYAELLRFRFLVPHEIYGRPDMIDLSKIKVDPKTRDYASRPLARMMNRPKLVANALKEYRRHGSSRPCWTYCCTVEHAKQVAEQYTAGGVTAAVITGDTSHTRRKELFESQSSGEIKVLCNVAVLTEGVDYPELGVVQLLRPTLSLGLHLQILGRGARPAKGKTNCIVLDHAGNCARHGFPDQIRDWSLEGKKQKDSAKGKPVKVKMKPCPRCKRLVPLQTHKCPHCGYHWSPKLMDGSLVRIAPRTKRLPALHPLV